MGVPGRGGGGGNDQRVKALGGGDIDSGWVGLP